MRRTASLLGRITVLFLSTIAAPLPAAQPHSSLPSPGVNIHFTDARTGEMEMLADGRFRWVRMDFTWGGTEREQGRYDFSAYDRPVDALDKHGIRVLFILDYSNNLYEVDRSVATEEGRQAYARWTAVVVDHFKGRGIV